MLRLRHAYDLSDEEVASAWVEYPYWQAFTGETYLQKKPPIDRPSLTHRFGRTQRILTQDEGQEQAVRVA